VFPQQAYQIGEAPLPCRRAFHYGYQQQGDKRAPDLYLDGNAVVAVEIL